MLSSGRVALRPLLSSSATNRLKIVWSFYQVVCLAPRVYSLELPTSVNAWLEGVSSVVDVNVGALTPLVCIGLGGFLAHLLIVVMLPITLMLLAFMWGVLAGALWPVTRTQKVPNVVLAKL